MFTGKGSFNAGYEKEDRKQEYGIKDWIKGKKIIKNKKRNACGR